MASCQCLFYAQLGKTAGSGMHMPWSAAKAHEARVGIGGTHFSQHLGASSTSRSMVMSPSDVSRSTDMVRRVLRRRGGVCRKSLVDATEARAL